MRRRVHPDSDRRLPDPPGTLPRRPASAHSGGNMCVLPTIALLAVIPAAAASDGAALYGQYCQGCHGLDASGLSRYGGDAAAFTKIIEGETVAEMPDFYGLFSDEDIEALFEFVRASSEPRAEP